MSSNNKALMTHYAEGAIISRELEHMMHDYAADARFDRELADDLELFTARKAEATPEGLCPNERDGILIHKRNPTS